MNSPKLVLLMGLFSMLMSCNTTIAQPVQSPVDFYSLSAMTIDGQLMDFSSLKGKRVLIVNTASKCGFTPQYRELQTLWENAKDKNFVILGFPCNQFGNQEAGDDQSIADFCEKNYGVTFQMMAKVKVKGDKQHPVYTWLTSKSENGAKSSQVLWNFHKFLVDDQGRWLGNYGSKTSPLDVDLTSFAYEDGH